MGCHHPTIVLSCSYFVHLLFFFLQKQKTFLPMYILLKWIISPTYLSEITILVSCITQYCGVWLSYNNPELLIFCPSCSLLQENVNNSTHNIKKKNQPTIFSELTNLIYCILQHHRIPLFYNNLQLFFFFFFLPTLVTSQKKIHIGAHSIKKDTQSHIFWWICRSCLLYEHITIMGHYPTAALNCSYFVHLLSFLSKNYTSTYSI